jgi:hypothetical protein
MTPSVTAGQRLSLSGVAGKQLKGKEPVQHPLRDDSLPCQLRSRIPRSRSPSPGLVAVALSRCGSLRPGRDEEEVVSPRASKLLGWAIIAATVITLLSPGFLWVPEPRVRLVPRVDDAR